MHVAIPALNLSSFQQLPGHCFYTVILKNFIDLIIQKCVLFSKRFINKLSIFLLIVLLSFFRLQVVNCLHDIRMEEDHPTSESAETESKEPATELQSAVVASQEDKTNHEDGRVDKATQDDETGAEEMSAGKPNSGSVQRGTEVH